MVAILIEGPAVEPIELAALRAALRLDSNVEDALLADLLKAARVHVEDLTGRKLIAQEWRIVVGAWPRERMLRLPVSPVIAVERVAVADAGGDFTDLPLDTVRLLAGDPPQLLVDDAAPAPGRARDGIRIDVLAGYGAAPGDVPAPLVEATRRIVARWFEHRGDGPESGLPADIASLVAPYRIARL